MGSESIAREAEGRMGYWLRGYEGDRNNCFSKIQLVRQKCRDKTTFSWLKLDVNPFLPPKIRRSLLLVGYIMYPSSSSTNQNAALIIDY